MIEPISMGQVNAVVVRSTLPTTAADILVNLTRSSQRGDTTNHVSGCKICYVFSLRIGILWKNYTLWV